MSSDPFELLELDRATATDADVRRAYAAKLKLTRPEEDRAGFMALRAAFEQARESVRWRDQYPEDDPYKDDEEKAHEDTQIIAPSEDDRQLPSSAEQTAVLEFEPGSSDLSEDAFEARVGRAMDRLVDLLTATGAAPDRKTLQACLDDNDVAGIDEFQTLQWRMRQLLCDRTGYNLEPQEIRLPLWLTLDVFDSLDQFYGWTRQPTTHPYVRRLNDWLVRVRADISWHAAPGDAQKQAVLQDLKAAQKDENGSMAWLGVAGAIIGYALYQFFTRNAAG